MTYTRSIVSDAFENDFRKSVREVSDYIAKLIHNDAVFINKSDSVFYLDNLAESLQCIDNKEALTKVIVSILSKQSIDMFKIAPFFSDFSVLYFIEMLKVLLIEKSDRGDLEKSLNKFEDSILSNVRESTSVGMSTDFFHFINKLQRNQLSSELIEYSCRYSGLDGKIFIERNQENHSVLEVKNAYSFDVETFDEFFFESNNWNHSFVNCIVIDGIIESVSEIHHLLEHASKNIDPVIIVARAFSDDVLQTLYVNMQRKTLNVFPIKLKNDEALINSFVDIATVGKTDPISYLKGELISSIDYEKTAVIDQAEVKKGKLLIVNPSSNMSTRRHLERLRKEIENKRDRLDPYSFDLYENSMRARIRSLSSKSVHISLNKDIDPQSIRKIKKDIDCGLRTLPIVRDYGMINLRDFFRMDFDSERKNAILEHSIRSFFKDTRSIPAGSFVRSIKACHENLKLLINTSGALIDDNKLQS